MLNIKDLYNGVINTIDQEKRSFDTNLNWAIVINLALFTAIGKGLIDEVNSFYILCLIIMAFIFTFCCLIRSAIAYYNYYTHCYLRKLMSYFNDQLNTLKFKDDLKEFLNLSCCIEMPKEDNMLESLKKYDRRGLDTGINLVVSYSYPKDKARIIWHVFTRTEYLFIFLFQFIIALVSFLWAYGLKNTLENFFKFKDHPIIRMALVVLIFLILILFLSYLAVKRILKTN